MPASPAHGALRVLAVDNCPDNADTLALLCRMWGHDCRVAYSGSEALALAAEYRPDVMLSDLSMPDVSGLELARRLGELGEACPALVAITGYSDSRRRRDASDAGFHLFLVKPADVEEIQRLLRDATELRGANWRASALVDELDCLQHESLGLIGEVRREIHGWREWN